MQSVLVQPCCSRDMKKKKTGEEIRLHYKAVEGESGEGAKSVKNDDLS